MSDVTPLLVQSVTENRFAWIEHARLNQMSMILRPKDEVVLPKEERSRF